MRSEGQWLVLTHPSLFRGRAAPRTSICPAQWDPPHKALVSWGGGGSSYSFPERAPQVLKEERVQVGNQAVSEAPGVARLVVCTYVWRGSWWGAW